MHPLFRLETEAFWNVHGEAKEDKDRIERFLCRDDLSVVISTFTSKNTTVRLT